MEENLALLGVKLNIPPFLRGKSNLVGKNWIASLRIHVEKSSGTTKAFSHIWQTTCIIL